MRIPRIPRFPRLFPGPARTAVECNVASIMRVPRAVRVPRTVVQADGTVRRVPGTTLVPVLPDGPARRFLLSEALSGADVRAYRPAASDQWNIWYGPLAPRYDARIPAATWHLFWDDLATKAAEAHATHAAAAQAITQAKGGDVR